MGQHIKAYMLIANMNGKEQPLFPVYGREQAERLADRLRRHHPISLVELDTGKILACTAELAPLGF